jgi:hypothetical protein
MADSHMPQFASRIRAKMNPGEGSASSGLILKANVT